MSRLEKLRSLLEQRPDDPFLLYGLGLEYRSLGMLQEALNCFADLTGRFPEYVPAYLQYGTLLIEQGDPIAAGELLVRGIQIAEKAGEDKVVSEISALLEELGS